MDGVFQVELKVRRGCCPDGCRVAVAVRDGWYVAHGFACDGVGWLWDALTEFPASDGFGCRLLRDVGPLAKR